MLPLPPHPGKPPDDKDDDDWFEELPWEATAG